MKLTKTRQRHTYKSFCDLCDRYLNNGKSWNDVGYINIGYFQDDAEDYSKNRYELFERTRPTGFDLTGETKRLAIGTLHELAFAVNAIFMLRQN